jgi:hypothetical protein
MVDQYCICEELHEDGSRHYHAAIKFMKKINIRNPRKFDICGVHPNFTTVRNWSACLAYCKKYDKNCLSNIEDGMWTQFAFCDSLEDLAEIAKNFGDKGAKALLCHGHVMNANRIKFFKPEINTDETYFGPWPKIPGWDPQTHCLILRGRPGSGKTQWARYLAMHSTKLFASDQLTPVYAYVKGPVDRLKLTYRKGMSIVYDDIKPDKSWNVNDWCSLFDVRNQGSVTLRNTNADLFPGVRIYCDNYDTEGHWTEGKIERRVFMVNADEYI